MQIQTVKRGLLKSQNPHNILVEDSFQDYFQATAAQDNLLILHSVRCCNSPSLFYRLNLARQAFRMPESDALTCEGLQLANKPVPFLDLNLLHCFQSRKRFKKKKKKIKIVSSAQEQAGTTTCSEVMTRTWQQECLKQTRSLWLFAGERWGLNNDE